MPGMGLLAHPMIQKRHGTCMGMLVESKARFWKLLSGTSARWVMMVAPAVGIGVIGTAATTLGPLKTCKTNLKIHILMDSGRSLDNCQNMSKYAKTIISEDPNKSVKKCPREDHNCQQKCQVLSQDNFLEYLDNILTKRRAAAECSRPSFGSGRSCEGIFGNIL